MSDISLNRLEEALSALGDLLEVAGEPSHLVVIGGSGLLAIEAVSRTTRDVDVVALEKDGTLISAEPLPDAIVDAAAVIARDLGLEENWLNTGPTSLLDAGLPTGFAERLTSRTYGSVLRVSFASRIDQIFFKLYAAADRRFPRDFADLRQLGATPEELRDAARWARTHNMPGAFDDQIARVLDDLGVEDEGRNA
jgi:hypothetical protein